MKKFAKKLLLIEFIGREIVEYALYIWVVSDLNHQSCDCISSLQIMH